MARCESAGARFVAIGEPDYPPILRNADQSPPLIAIMGNTDTLAQKCVAIVGSRNSSIAGMKLTQRFAAQLGEQGYVIASGLARGIDTAAHRASLKTGTIAVFAGGVDHIFPDENVELAKSIVDNGGILMSEMPMGWQPRAKDFPREAAKRSGSLISARLANEMGRIVLAVPGSPLDPRSEGTNGLIKQGATLITSTDDIIDALAPLDPSVGEFIYDISEPKDELPYETEQLGKYNWS